MKDIFIFLSSSFGSLVIWNSSSTVM